MVACLVLGGLSLAIPSTLTYDPLTWANWSREIVHLDLNTRTGPAWKPLPVLVDLPFAFFGPLVKWVWLALARAGGFLFVVMAFRLARRMGGAGAGLFAAVGVVFSTSFVFYLMAVGLSEPMLAGLALLAIERHLDGHRSHAVWLIYLCVLLRPELLIFFVGYGAVLWRSQRGWRAWLVAGVLILPIVLFLPDQLGSGDLLRSSNRAANPSEGGPLTTSFPAGAVLASAASAVIVPVLAGLFVITWTTIRAWHRSREERLPGALLLLGAGSLLWDALLTQFHKSAGDQRYLIISYGLACVLAGVGWARAVDAAVAWRASRPVVARRSASLAIVAVTLLFVWGPVSDLPGNLRAMLYQVHKYGQLQSIVENLGRSRILACGPVLADTYQAAALAWDLGVPTARITLVPEPPNQMPPRDDTGTVFRTSNLGGATPVVPGAPHDRDFEVADQTTQWQVLSTCTYPLPY